MAVGRIEFEPQQPVWTKKVTSYPAVRGRARVPHQPGKMNKLEQAYADHLELRLRAGEIASFDFEPEKFRLADRTYYTPDFRVILPDGLVEFHEVKGHWEDDARVKTKVAAEMHPYTFVGVRRKPKKDGGGWKYEWFNNDKEANKHTP